MILFWIFFAVVLIFGLVVFRGSPYVPSRRKYINQAFTELYQITKKDKLIDIGSGDGVVLREAAKLGARAIGYEINPILVLVSRLLSIKNKNVSVYLADFWSIKIPSDATVIYVFSVERDIENIAQKIQKEITRIGHPVYLISYAGEFCCFKLIKKVAAYNLYIINPLQPDKAQV